MFLFLWVQLLLRGILAFVFISYGLSKLWNIPQFRTVIEQHQLLPGKFVTPVAIILPILEIAGGMLLLSTAGSLQVSLGLGMALVIFSVLLVRGLVKPELHLSSCGCSGVSESSRGIKRALLRNVVLLCLTGLLIGLLASGRTATQPLALPWILGLVLLPCIWATGTHVNWKPMARLRQRCSVLILPARFSLDSQRTGSRRRTFLRWGLGIGLGILGYVLFERPLQADAWVCNCDCGSTGYGDPDCISVADCEGHEGQEVEVYYSCEYYCCGRPLHCDSTYKAAGYTVYCEPGGGC